MFYRTLFNHHILLKRVCFLNRWRPICRLLICIRNPSGFLWGSERMRSISSCLRAEGGIRSVTERERCQLPFKVDINRTKTTSGAKDQAGSEAICWKCQKSTSTWDLFCRGCGSIQQPLSSRNYFEILGVPTIFEQDEKVLRQKFRNLQRSLHPDKFAQKSSVEKGYSEDHSSLVNKSYQTLLKPLTRGIYLLGLKGETIEEGQKDMDPIFLMKIMEINEELETSDLEVITRIEAANEEDLKRHMSDLTKAFEDDDLLKAKAELTFLKYYANIRDKVKELKFDLTGTN